MARCRLTGAHSSGPVCDTPPSQGPVCPELVVVLPAERCVAVAAGLDLADALAE